MKLYVDCFVLLNFPLQRVSNMNKLSKLKHHQKENAPAQREIKPRVILDQYNGHSVLSESALWLRNGPSLSASLIHS